MQCPFLSGLCRTHWNRRWCCLPSHRWRHLDHSRRGSNRTQTSILARAIPVAQSVAAAASNAVTKKRFISSSSKSNVVKEGRGSISYNRCNPYIVYNATKPRRPAYFAQKNIVFAQAAGPVHRAPCNATISLLAVAAAHPPGRCCGPGNTPLETVLPCQAVKSLRPWRTRSAGAVEQQPLAHGALRHELAKRLLIEIFQGDLPAGSPDHLEPRRTLPPQFDAGARSPARTRSQRHCSVRAQPRAISQTLRTRPASGNLSLAADSRDRGGPAGMLPHQSAGTRRTSRATAESGRAAAAASGWNARCWPTAASTR